MTGIVPIATADSCTRERDLMHSKCVNHKIHRVHNRVTQRKTLKVSRNLIS